MVRRSAIWRTTIPNALDKQLAVVAIVTGSWLAAAAATAAVAVVDRLKDEGSMNTRLLPPATRTPATLLAVIRLNKKVPLLPSSSFKAWMARLVHGNRR